MGQDAAWINGTSADRRAGIISSPSDTVAMILPPREGFSPAASGAVGLLVHRLATASSRLAPLVVGMPASAPFADVPFRAPCPVWWLWPHTQARRYAAGVARLLDGVRPALIEVHNRPDVALFLAERFPAIPVGLFLHNDPQGMRHAHSAAERTRLIARLACVVTVSAFLRGRLLEGVPAVRPPVVLPNCLDLRQMPPPRARDNLIVFAGRVVADKGADVFVRACARCLPALPGWRAEMVGADRFGAASPDTPFLRALRPEARRAGVAMLGYRPHAEVLEAMARAAIVVVPSRWQEPFGLCALEAMACGAALLCSPRGGLAEVTAGAAVPIDPDDADGLAGHMVALAGDAERRSALGEAGRARARAFDLPQAAARLDALRAEILATWSPHDRRPI
jgi:glycosyltransferase involved in cell wall biosynthesis